MLGDNIESILVNLRIPIEIRTPLATDTLQKMSYTNVRNYSDRFIGWRKADILVGN